MPKEFIDESPLSKIKSFLWCQALQSKSMMQAVVFMSFVSRRTLFFSRGSLGNGVYVSAVYLRFFLLEGGWAGPRFQHKTSKTSARRGFIEVSIHAHHQPFLLLSPFFFS